MPFEQFERIAERIITSHSWFVRKVFPSSIIFDLTGVGEALLNPRFLDMVEVLKKRRVTVILSDNFTLMDEGRAERLLRAGVDVVFVSFDGGTKETYEKLRAGATFEKTLTNIDRFIELRARLVRSRPIVVLRALVMKENVGELCEIVRLAGEHRIGFVSFDHLNTHPLTRHLKAPREAYEAESRKAVELGKKIGVTVNCAPYPKLSYRLCSRPFNSVNITAEGHILPCCFANEQKHYSELGRWSLGNAFKEDIIAVWRSERYKSFRRKLSNGPPPLFCRDCYLYSADGRITK